MKYLDTFLATERKVFAQRETVLTNGAYAARVGVDIDIKAGDLTRGASTVSVIPFSAASRNVRVTVSDVEVQPYGINRLLVDTSGAFVPDKFVEEWSKSLKYNKQVLNDYITMLNALPRGDSHLSWVLNMCVSAATAELGVKDKTYDPVKKTFILRLSKYKDSHFERAFNELAQDEYEEIALTKANTAVEPRYRVNKREHFADILLPDMSGAALNFAVTHLFGRKKKTSLNIDMDLPPCSPGLMCVDSTAIPGDVGTAYDPTDYKFMWGVIASVVKFLRIEHELAAAMQILSQVFFMPEPDTVEGTMWRDVPVEVHIPPFKSLRSAHELFRTGEAYRVTECPAGLADMTATPLANFIAHGFVNMYSYIGIYDLVSRFAINGNPFCNLPDEYLEPSTCMAAAAAHASGMHVASYMQQGVGVKLMFDTKMVGISIPVRNVATGQTQGLNITYLPTPCSTVLMLGRTPEPVSTMSHLRDFSIAPDPTGTRHLERIDVVRFAQFLRLMGYDSSYIDLHAGFIIGLWASAKSKMVQPHAMPFYAISHLYDLNDYDVRENAKDVPAPETLLELGPRISYMSRIVRLINIDNRDALPVIVTKPVGLPQIKFLIETPYRKSDYSLPYTPYPGSYFRDAARPTGAAPEVSVPTSQSQQTIYTEATPSREVPSGMEAFGEVEVAIPAMHGSSTEISSPQPTAAQTYSSVASSSMTRQQAGDFSPAGQA